MRGCFPRRKDVSNLIIENNVSKDFPFYCSSFRANCDAIFFYPILLFSCLYFLCVSYSNDDDRFARDNIDTLYASISSCFTWLGKTLFIYGSSKYTAAKEHENQAVAVVSVGDAVGVIVCLLHASLPSRAHVRDKHDNSLIHSSLEFSLDPILFILQFVFNRAAFMMNAGKATAAMTTTDNKAIITFPASAWPSIEEYEIKIWWLDILAVAAHQRDPSSHSL